MLARLWLPSSSLERTWGFQGLLVGVQSPLLRKAPSLMIDSPFWVLRVLPGHPASFMGSSGLSLCAYYPIAHIPGVLGW